ncbi:MAG: hypothetical protein NTV43_05360 [Methylococcales bacterium]|nr:hypothetical protein [Methylococcales bacterium]
MATTAGVTEAGGGVLVATPLAAMGLGFTALFAAGAGALVAFGLFSPMQTHSLLSLFCSQFHAAWLAA